VQRQCRLSCQSSEQCSSGVEGFRELVARLRMRMRVEIVMRAYEVNC
jgi:hypothetical protein